MRMNLRTEAVEEEQKWKKWHKWKRERDKARNLMMVKYREAALSNEQRFYVKCFGRFVDWLVCVRLQELHKQLEEVTKDTEIVEIRQREAECELEASRDRVQQQATEILLKASEIRTCSPITSVQSHSAHFHWFILLHCFRLLIHYQRAQQDCSRFRIKCRVPVGYNWSHPFELNLNKIQNCN